MTQFHWKSTTPLILHLIIFFFFLPTGIFSSGVVTLESIKIFTTHEIFYGKPEVYFRCRGENMTFLPDVKEKNTLYTFKGEESWQPLTEFTNKKCKRCGFYEKDPFKPDDTFEEWELCPSDFTAPDGKYARFAYKEFNATFLCPQCVPFGTGSIHTLDNGEARKGGMHTVAVVLITLSVSTVCILGAIFGYKYWLRKKREQDRMRFLKLFDDVDDMEDDFGLG